jgi:hypothetical protein
MAPDTHTKVPTPYSDAEMDRYGALLTAIGELTAGVKTMQTDIGYIKANVDKSNSTCEKQSEKVAAKLSKLDDRIIKLETFKDRALWAFAILSVLFMAIGVPILVSYIKSFLGI